MAKRGITVRCAEDHDGYRCTRWIIPDPKHNASEMWMGKRLWFCKSCTELRILRDNRNIPQLDDQDFEDSE